MCVKQTLYSVFLNKQSSLIGREEQRLVGVALCFKFLKRNATYRSWIKQSYSLTVSVNSSERRGGGKGRHRR